MPDAAKAKILIVKDEAIVVADLQGEITVSLHTDQTGYFNLCVSDNGIGLPTDLNWRQTSTLGLRLVQMLTEQLAGTLEVCIAGGTFVTLSFARET